MKENVIEGNKLIAADRVKQLGYVVLDGGFVISKRSLSFLKLHKGTSGYFQLNAYSEGKQESYLVHILVAQMFVPNPYNLPEVNHKDGNKENNWASNLEWCTRSQNIQHGFDTGLKDIWTFYLSVADAEKLIKYLKEQFLLP